jgi:hypothetical protein
MKTKLKTTCLLVLTVVTLVISAKASSIPDALPPASLGPALDSFILPSMVARPRTLPSAEELAAYGEKDRQFQSAAGQRAAGAAADNTTIIVVAVIVAVAAVCIGVAGSNSIVIHP